MQTVSDKELLILQLTHFLCCGTEHSVKSNSVIFVLKFEHFKTLFSQIMFIGTIMSKSEI